MRYAGRLERATLLRRYKRFLVDVERPDGVPLTLHCANTGAMTGCATPGLEVWYGSSSNAARKYPHSLEVVCTTNGRVGVNTARANQLVEEALRESRLDAFADYDRIQREARVPGSDARLDFRLDGSSGCCWIEVKSMTLAGADGRGAFPDAVSARALRHVEALVERRRAGERSVLLFCAQHTGIRWATTADEVDPAYGEAVRRAVDHGVEVMAFACHIDRCSIRLADSLPVVLP